MKVTVVEPTLSCIVCILIGLAFINLNCPSGKTYSLITIPGDQTSSVAPPTNGQIVSSIDYNELLWIEKSSLTEKVPEYCKYRSDVVLGILTVPFKFRPAIGDNASSAIDGSFNIGPYVVGDLD